MEVVLGAFFQKGGEVTFIDRIWSGQTRSWFSLEIVSEGGKIRFFIWTKPKHRNLIESQIYSQYPGVEIYEAEDYTRPLYYDPEKNNVWGCEFALTKEDPYPIKTYVDYGLDKDPDEEFKIDPITPFIEFLGSITAGHNIWFQIIIRAHSKERFWGLFNEQEDGWKNEAEIQIKKLIEKFKPEDKEKFGRMPTKGELDVISALERSIAKLPFDCGMRGIYIAEKDKFDGSNIGGLLGSLKQYGSLNLNGFKPTGWFPWIDYPWQKWFGREDKFRKLLLEEYKFRRFFFSPWKGKYFYSKPFVLNAEELATIFHFPGSVAATPTFGRVPSKKSEAPANLPL